MGTFLVLFSAVLGLAILRAVVARKRNPYSEVAFDALPQSLREEIARSVPEFQPTSIRITKRQNEARLQGSYLGQRASIEGDFDPSGALVDFEFEASEGARVRTGIEPSELPEPARRRVDALLGDRRASFVERRVTGGSVHGEGNYKIVGDTSSWNWEIEVSESGTLLELEKERRRG